MRGRIPDLYRIGSTIDPKCCIREHGSSHGDLFVNTTVFIKVCEQAVNVFLKGRKYNGSKEVYNGDCNMFKEVVMNCGMAAAIVLASSKGRNVDKYVP